MGSTSERYVEMLRNFLRPQLRSLRVNMEDMWFQQDGATAHTARASMTAVRQTFPQRVISSFGDVPWPPRSPDLSACDFFLWGYLKSKVYVRKPRTVDDLKVSIREEIATVPQEMLVNVTQNFEERLRTRVRQEGRHLSNIIFRKWEINVGNQSCIYYRLFWCWHNFFILKINKVTIIWKICILFAPHCRSSNIDKNHSKSNCTNDLI